jgi:hypothetical protein
MGKRFTSKADNTVTVLNGAANNSGADDAARVLNGVVAVDSIMGLNGRDWALYLWNRAQKDKSLRPALDMFSVDCDYDNCTKREQPADIFCPNSTEFTTCARLAPGVCIMGHVRHKHKDAERRQELGEKLIQGQRDELAKIPAAKKSAKKSVWFWSGWGILPAAVTLVYAFIAIPKSEGTVDILDILVVFACGYATFDSFKSASESFKKYKKLCARENDLTQKLR